MDEPEASSFPAGKGFFLEQDENRELNAFSPPRGGWFGFVLGFFFGALSEVSIFSHILWRYGRNKNGRCCLIL